MLYPLIRKCPTLVFMKQSVSDRLKNIDQTYQQVKSVIDTKVVPKGYIIIDEKYHPESFGSRYVT